MKLYDRILLYVYIASSMSYTLAFATGNGSDPLKTVWGWFTIVTVARFGFLLWRKFGRRAAKDV